MREAIAPRRLFGCKPICSTDRAEAKHFALVSNVAERETERLLEWHRLLPSPDITKIYTQTTVC